jgi:hypothetical protein
VPIPPSPPTVQVKNAGTLVGTRRGINFLAGTGITRTITDDAANNEVEVTLAQTLPTEASVRAYHNAAQSIANATGTAVALNSERVDTDGFHDSSTNNTRLTVPSGLAGKYQITAHIAWGAGSVGVRQLQLRLNGTTIIADNTISPPGAFAFSVPPVTTMYTLAVGDYVEIVVTQSSGGALDVISSGNISPEFSMVRIGGVLASGGSASAAHVTRAATQAITTAVETAISFDTEVRDDGGYWVVGSPTRLTIPATGWYNLSGHTIWEANTTGIRYGALMKNGTDYLAYVSNGPHATNGNFRENLAINVYLTAGDYIEMKVTHDRGSNLNAGGGLSVAKIGLG